MGIKGLTKLLADNAPNGMKQQTFESYFGRKIAIDASMSIYQFLIVVGRNGTEMLTNETGEVTSHLQGMFYRTIRLLGSGIKPLYVFDGKPPELKSRELAKRYTKRADATDDLAQAIEVTKQHNEDCKRLLRLMGVPVVEAPSEAEAQCAALCKAGKVYAVASEDMDTLTFGAPRFLCHLMSPSSRKIPVMEFEIAKILGELNLTMDQFIDLCILGGCDYCDNIRGIGGKTALKLIQQHGSIENVLKNINKKRYLVPEDWPYQEARRLFLEPSVCVDGEETEWNSPDEEGLISFLVHENGFNNDRVTKAVEKLKASTNMSSQDGLELFLKPVATVPVKRKLKSKTKLVCKSVCIRKLLDFLEMRWRFDKEIQDRQVTKCMLGPPKPAIKCKMLSVQACVVPMPKSTQAICPQQLSYGSKQSSPISRSVCFGT